MLRIILLGNVTNNDQRLSKCIIIISAIWIPMYRNSIESDKVCADFRPVISPEDFFYPNKPLPEHNLETSPCYPIIAKTPDGLYYCILHPKEVAMFLDTIELQHCRLKNPDLHFLEIQKRLALEAQEKSCEIKRTTNTSIGDIGIEPPSNGSSKFKCFRCDIGFSNKVERLKHTDIEHPGKLYYPEPEDFDNRLER